MMGVRTHSGAPAPVAPLPARELPRSVHFSMARSVHFSVAIDTPFNLKQAAQPRLGCHVSDFQIFQTPDFGPFLTGMGQPPESPMSIEEALPFTVHERKQHGDLRRPETLTGVVACFQYSPSELGPSQSSTEPLWWTNDRGALRRGDPTESHPQGPAAPPGG